MVRSSIRIRDAMLFLVVLVTSVLTSLTSAVETCPYPEDLSPCTCFQNMLDKATIEVFCKGGDLLDMQRPMEHLRGKDVFQLRFEGVRLGKLPSLFFKGMKVTYLTFQDCQMTDLVDHPEGLALDGLQDSLKILYLKNSLQGRVKPPALSHLQRLVEMGIIDSAIPEVDAEWMSGMPTSLKDIRLANNGIRYLGSKAMAHLTNLGDFYLRGQEITSFRRDCLPNPAKWLTYIDLRDCQLTSLPEDMFLEMPELKSVYIFGNQIRRFSSRTWSPVWSQLYTLSAEGNPIECDEHNEWMYKVKRPPSLYATCASPPSKAGKKLDAVIDANKQ